MPEHEPALEPESNPDRPGRRWAWILLPLAGLLLLATLLADRWPEQAIVMETPTPSIIVGEIGGAIVSPVPTPQLTPQPTARPTAPPTVEPTAVPTAVPTAIPAATPPPTSVPAATPAPPTPEPTAVVAVAGEPADTVASFYSHAVDGDFDAAYALWSDRMKAEFPRQENLDGRFDETASITFTQLRTVTSDAGRAVVQANFVEAYESGATREFIGYWELVLVDGGWLLDQPHY